MSAGKLNSGSVWNRWEPHVHAPGTLLNDQFSGDNPWEDYLTAIETSDPPISALAVTDYYLTDIYERVLASKRDGRLASVDLIFPNIELRLDVGTVRGRWVNLHLLVSPQDPEHVVQAQRFLDRIRFRAHNDTFACTKADFIRLGKAADASITDDVAALRHGALQFKVPFDQIREEYDKSGWAKENVLIAIAGSQTDGTSGVRDAADATLREEMEKFAHIIFASSAAQREFWLGLRTASKEQLKARYGGLKPCLHGSDGHETPRVGVPDDNRYSWIKGGLEFDALRQACIDPEGRAFVGAAPPQPGAASQLIDRLELIDAPWAGTPVVALNPGLVAIIGARGSGKTALADIIALACDAMPEPPDLPEEAVRPPSSSFVERAGDLLGDAKVRVRWRAGDPELRSLDGSDEPDIAFPRVRYLSQQFVEELCSANKMTDKLMKEIKRVIFEAHPLLDRDGALDFDELLELRSQRFRQAREREEEAIVQISDRIGAEYEKDRQVGELTNQVQQAERQIKGYSDDRAKLVAKGSEQRAERLSVLATAAEKVRGYVRYFNTQEQALLALRDEVADMRQNKAPEQLRSAQARHAASRMKPEEWQPFLLDCKGEVDAQLKAAIEAAGQQAAKWKGAPPKPPATPETPLVSDDVELDEQTLALLEAEIQRLQKLVNADVLAQRQFSALTTKIATETTGLEVLKQKLEDAKGAKERIGELLKEREAAYKRVFDAICSEQNVLTALYAPLMERLKANSGTLGKLRFSVARTVDTALWAKKAEEDLVDLRRQGPFKGRGNLQTFAEEVLGEAWASGDGDVAAAAMAAFRKDFQDDLLEHSKVPKGNANYRAWLRKFAQWLFSTNHIRLQYGVEYDGVDIRKLSPGTRGIVLLLLYLALDDADDRPLIIDQPEENLDPKSVFDELVSLFIEAKTKRQVIMVTHNANLVINTDADQIIIAQASDHSRERLPKITWTSGGLENADIRKAVCDILEGGEAAFKERARRLRVGLER